MVSDTPSWLEVEIHINSFSEGFKLFSYTVLSTVNHESLISSSTIFTLLFYLPYPIG